MINIIGKGGMSREFQSYLAVPSTSIQTFEHEEIEKLLPNAPAYIAIGDGKVRKKIAEKYPHFYYPSFVTPSTQIWGHIVTGQGTIIGPVCLLTTDIIIGKFCILNKNCSISHDVKMGDYATISPGAVLCGNVTLGNNVFIGANATVIEKIKICDDVIIGAGAVVIRDILFPGTYVGNPARHITFH